MKLLEIEKERDHLREQLQIAEAVIRFYAHTDNWTEDGGIQTLLQISGDSDDGLDGFNIFGGKKAREYLKAKDNYEGG